MHERLRVLSAREDGVSLIEMLVAILILGIALAAFASSMVSSLQAVARDQRLVVANALATEVVENLQGLSWENAGLYEDEATSELGGTTFEGEDLVLISGSRPVGGSPVPAPVRTETRDGIDYTVTTAVTWVDDDADDVGSDDETGDSDDYKRFVVELEWSLRGNTRDLRVTALRSAETRERPLRPEAPDTVPIDDAACMETPIDLSATTLDPASYVKALYVRRGETSPTEVDLVHAGDSRTWSRTLSSCSTHGPFPDGPVLFTFRAEDRATGEIYEATEIVVFERDVAVADITVTPETIEVDASGQSTCEVTVTVDVDGGTPDDTVTATWERGPEPVDLAFEQLTAAGATFTHLYPVGTDFGSTGPTTLTIDVDREYDGALASGTAPAEISESDGTCPS